jgi:hypothetical protein
LRTRLLKNIPKALCCKSLSNNHLGLWFCVDLLVSSICLNSLSLKSRTNTILKGSVHGRASERPIAVYCEVENEDRQSGCGDILSKALAVFLRPLPQIAKMKTVKGKNTL